ncbi:unnamed protein product [Amoebophrya sp. A25]|nr:unnamed protein product [Amoebophrya sp. A25]|eukprot:GSA25T00020868001.1
MLPKYKNSGTPATRTRSTTLLEDWWPTSRSALQQQSSKSETNKMTVDSHPRWGAADIEAVRYEQDEYRDGFRYASKISSSSYSYSPDDDSTTTFGSSASSPSRSPLDDDTCSEATSGSGGRRTSGLFFGLIGGVGSSPSSSGRPSSSPLSPGSGGFEDDDLFVSPVDDIVGCGNPSDQIQQEHSPRTTASLTKDLIQRHRDRLRRLGVSGVEQGDQKSAVFFIAVCACFVIGGLVGGLLAFLFQDWRRRAEISTYLAEIQDDHVASIIRASKKRRGRTGGRRSTTTTEVYERHGRAGGTRASFDQSASAAAASDLHGNGLISTPRQTFSDEAEEARSLRAAQSVFTGVPAMISAKSSSSSSSSASSTTVEQGSKSSRGSSTSSASPSTSTSAAHEGQKGGRNQQRDADSSGSSEESQVYLATMSMSASTDARATATAEGEVVFRQKHGKHGKTTAEDQQVAITSSSTSSSKSARKKQPGEIIVSVDRLGNIMLPSKIKIPDTAFYNLETAQRYRKYQLRDDAFGAAVTVTKVGRPVSVFSDVLDAVLAPYADEPFWHVGLMDAKNGVEETKFLQRMLLDADADDLDKLVVQDTTSRSTMTFTEHSTSGVFSHRK